MTITFDQLLARLERVENDLRALREAHEKHRHGFSVGVGQTHANGHTGVPYASVTVHQTKFEDSIAKPDPIEEWQDKEPERTFVVDHLPDGMYQVRMWWGPTSNVFKTAPKHSRAEALRLARLWCTEQLDKPGGTSK